MTYDHSLLGGLAVGRTLSHPADGDGAAAVEDVQSGERNLGLRALAIHELLAAVEGRAGDVLRELSATVHQAVDDGSVVNEVLGEGVEGELIGVVLDKLAEDVGHVLSLLVSHTLLIVGVDLGRLRGVGGRLGHSGGLDRGNDGGAGSREVHGGAAGVLGHATWAAVVVATLALVPVLGVIAAALGGRGSERSGGERRCGESGSETHLG